MRVCSAITAVALGLAFVAGPSNVSAQQRMGPEDPRLAGDSRAFSEERSLPRRTLSWLRDRVGLNVDVEPVGPQVTAGRPEDARQLNDVEAGAYYRVSPRLRVGAAVPLSQNEVDTRASEADRRTQPRVRLETIFKF